MLGEPPRAAGSSRTVVSCVGCGGGCGHEHAYEPEKSASATQTGSRFDFRYVEGSSLRGYDVDDVGDVVGAHARLTFGCATTVTALFRTQATDRAADGICGLGEAATSQTSNRNQRASSRTPGPDRHGVSRPAAECEPPHNATESPPPAAKPLNKAAKPPCRRPTHSLPCIGR